MPGPHPCAIRGAGVTRRRREIRPASIPELADLVEATPDRLRAAVVLAAWCGLRFGEISELRRGDVDLETGTVHVRRAVVRIDRQEVVGRARGSLLFTTPSGEYWTHGSFSKSDWIPARAAAHRPDLRFHDLRHTSAVLAAQSGKTFAELMTRRGHSTSAAVVRYQHAAAGRDAEIAAALSRMAVADVVPLVRRGTRGA